MWVPPASKAETRLTLRGCPLPRRFRQQLRLCLCRDVFAKEVLFDTTAGSGDRRPLLVVRPCLLWDVGRAQRCRLLVVRPCLAWEVGRTLRRLPPVV